MYNYYGDYMNKYESIARGLHKDGHNCSYSIHNAFKEDFNLSDNYPMPRSIDGKCGALLACTNILSELNEEELIPEFEQKFIEQFGYLKCGELIRNGRICNDNIGISARILSELLNK